MGMVIILAILIYIVVSAVITLLIFMKSKRIVYGLLAAIFFILLPTWDVLLGKAVYSIACRYVPKVAIYETVETDGIYYEGMHDYIYELERSNDTPLSERIQVGAISDVFRENYSYAEAKVTKRHPYIGVDYCIAIPPVYYRCTPLPPDPRGPQFQRMSCIVVDQPKSRYVVKVSQKKILITSIESKKIFDRSNRKLMAEYHQATIAKRLPFFHWLGWQPRGGSLINCPNSDRYYYFEYEVLKPKNK